MKVGSIDLAPPFALAPMAGMTDTAFRRLVKRRGGCGLVVTEMVSSEGLVRGIDRTLEFAEFTEEERPVSIQIFGGDPVKMAAAAQIVEGMGADIVDVNMGCPVPKIAKHNAGCSLMREPEHAASVIAAITSAACSGSRIRLQPALCFAIFGTGHPMLTSTMSAPIASTICAAAAIFSGSPPKI